MSESGEVCGRCGHPINEVVARLAIESGPLHDSHPTMDLCAGCSESLERWVARRGRGRSSRRSSGGGSHERSHRESEDEAPAAFSQLASGVMFLQSENARQILVTLIVVAIFALSVTFLVSILR